MQGVSGIDPRSGAGIAFGWLPALDASAFEGQRKAVIEPLKRVHALVGAGHYAEALEILDRPLRGGTIESLATGDVQRAAYASRGVALYQVGRVAEAITALKVAIEAGGPSNEADNQGYGYALHGILAHALVDLGQLAEAVEEFSVAIDWAWLTGLGTAAPSTVAAGYSMRGHICGLLGRFEEAVEDTSRAIELDLQSATACAAHDTLGRALLRLGRFEEVLQACERGIAADDPLSAELCALRGSALHGLGRRDEAVAALDQAVAIKPGWGMGHMARGDALWNAGRQAEAIDAYRRALEHITEKEEFATVSGTLATIAKYQAAVLLEFDIKPKGVGESKAAAYTGEHGGSVGDETAAFRAVAAQEKISPVVLRTIINQAKAASGEVAARETTTRATEPPRPVAAAVETTTRKRGPRVKRNPALPATATEIYRDRKPREELGGKKENIVEFIERVYAPWREILTRADLRRLDRTADKGVENWIDKGKQLPVGLLLTEYELNTDKRELEAKRQPKRRFARMLRGEAPAV